MDTSALNDVMHQGSGHWWYRVRRGMVRDLIRTHAPSARTVLDVGCASGDTIFSLKDIYDVTGVEISDEAIKLAHARGLNIVKSSLPAIPFPDSSFDVVLMLDVLEHLKDDDAALAEVRRVLKPGGVSIIFVPAFMFLWSITDVLSHHERRYTRGPLLERIRRAELVVARSSYFNTFLFPAIAGVRLVMRAFGMPMKTEMGKTSPTVNAVLYGVFMVESLIGRFISYPFGVSIYAVSKKSK